MSRHSGVLEVGSAGDELRGVRLGDARLNKRAVELADRLAKAPAQSFPKLSTSDAELEATYRFLSNERVDPSALVAAHAAQTAQRCQGRRVVIVASDTMEASFEGDRKELGFKSTRTQSLLAHVALAISADEERTPLGALVCWTWTRKQPVDGRTEGKRKDLVKKSPRAMKESARWDHVVDLARAELPPGTDAIHVADREADDYAFIAHCVETNARFVVRADKSRVLNEWCGLHLSDVLDEVEHVLFRKVVLSQRLRAASAKQNRRNPPRDERMATLHVRAARVTMRRNGAQANSMKLDVNVVQVFEPNPPTNEAPIEWTLLTTEPISTPQEIAFIVDCYRARWRIEEFFKALKTGCSFEKRQLGSYDALRVALALFLPIAWRLMVLRRWGRLSIPPPASMLFTVDQLELLRLISKRVKLPDSPDLTEAMYAIAGLAGHLRRNGPPGWQLLGAGYQEFLRAEQVARLLREK
jgi:hypothetical protein